jgi:hypothetical protein
MAEEEVDWGMDESVDVDEWRRGAVEEAVEVGDEDVISLDGAEDGEGQSHVASSSLFLLKKGGIRTLS